MLPLSSASLLFSWIFILQPSLLLTFHYFDSNKDKRSSVKYSYVICFGFSWSFEFINKESSINGMSELSEMHVALKSSQMVCNWMRSSEFVTDMDPSTRKLLQIWLYSMCAFPYLLVSIYFADGDCASCQIWQKSSTLMELLVDPLVSIESSYVPLCVHYSHCGTESVLSLFSCDTAVPLSSSVTSTFLWILSTIVRGTTCDWMACYFRISLIM